MSRRIIFTGARDWDDAAALYRAWDEHVRPGDTIIHGAAVGLDSMVDDYYADPFWGVEDVNIERYPARDFPDPKARNAHMVMLGADLCLAFANRWASGTGHCARTARKAGIHTIDYGVSTHSVDRPGRPAGPHGDGRSR